MPDEPIKKAVEAAPDALEDSAVIEAMLAELAALSPVEYDQRREKARKRLGVRVTTLDAEVAKRRPATESDTDTTDLFSDPDPWPDPVDGAAMLDALATSFTRYVVLPDGAADALALWVVFAHAHDAAYVSPIMTVTSPLKRCGKTTCLGIIKELAPRALPTANITSAALFRTVEKWEPTVIIDEADTFLRDNDELRGVLNSGHVRGSGGVIRTVGDNHEPRRFSTWAPKAIALIGALPDTLADRSIHVRLRRKRPDESVERVRLDRMDDLTVLKRQAARWAADNLDALRGADPDVPVGLHDRAADNWRTILSIADLAGGGWPDRARETATALSADGDDDASAKVMLLIDIRALFAERHTDRITSVDLVLALVAMEERPWPEWKHGKPITTRGVVRLLADFQIRPKTFRVDVHTTAKGYLLDDLKDTFSQYIPDPSVTRSQPNETGAYSENPSVTPPPNVTDGKGRKPAENKECYRVTDEKGGAGEKWDMEI